MAASGLDAGGNSSDLMASTSPRLGRSTVETIAKEEAKGTPLNTSWTFWVDKSVPANSAAEYEAAMKKLYTVNTVEGFWSVYNNIPAPEKLSIRYSYHLMRHERKPLWEDVSHCNGGNWRFKCPKESTGEAWKELLVGAIGEKLSDMVAKGDEVSGVSISVRQHDNVIQIWNTKSNLSDEATIIEGVTRNLLKHIPFSTAFYKAFQDNVAFEGK